MGLVVTMIIMCCRSHPDVAERHYPDLFKEFFPQGLPVHGFAY